MVGTVNTIGSIATYLIEVFPDLPEGVSGNLIIVADTARQYVENYTGVVIGSNSIARQYQPAILDFAKADTVDLFNAQAGGEKLHLAELSIEETGEQMSAEQYRILGEMKLKVLGKGTYQVARTLS